MGGIENELVIVNPKVANRIYQTTNNFDKNLHLTFGSLEN